VIGVTYLNHAGLAPLRARSALAGLIPWELAGNAFLPRMAGRIGHLREAVGTWLGVEERNVAFLPSTTAALGAVAASIPWTAGDVVLFPARDFPANVFPWTDAARHGVRAVAIEDWDAPFPERTRLVAISTVDYTTGTERPWREVCARARRIGAWTCVDAIQSAGVRPSRSPDVDFWAAGTQKWLAAGLGLAVLAVSDRALGALEGPWHTYLGLRDPRDHASGPADSARRWELGWVTPTALLRFEGSLRGFERIGWDEVSAGVRRKRDRLHERLLETGWPVVSDPVRWSGIVSLDPAPFEAAAIVEDGYRRRIVTAARDRYVRLSPHRWTSDREIDRAVDWLWRIRSGRIALPESSAGMAATQGARARATEGAPAA
jgi:selenocysteine lyase/cysteine desulfurase